jgi:hypothetical protein
MASKYNLGDYTFQFVTITIGVLIALLINGLVEWNSDRELVADARAMIAREIADNKTDIDATLSGIKGDLEKFDSAIQFATDLLTTKKTSVNELNFHINLADLSSTSWRTAERTGALSHMDYAEVQKYSKLYDFQDLIVEQQRNLISQLGLVTAIISPGFDPDTPNLKDLELFRERAMTLRAALVVHNQMALRLAESYAEALKQ